MRNSSCSKDQAARRAKRSAAALRAAVYAGAGICVAVLAGILVYILVKGVPNLTPELFSLQYTSENASVVPALLNTLVIVVLSLAIAVPLGIFSAIYLVEYAKKGNRFVKVVRVTAETLAGIPSIVYGLFGYLLFVTTLGFGYSLLAGALTLSIMILPVILRTTEEALQSVPDLYREGSFGLGAGKLRTVFRIVLPSAAPGILAGVILAVGRLVGETAALIYTGGSSRRLAGGFMQSGATLAIHMYLLANEGLHVGEAWATAVVLIVLVVVINGLAEFVGNKLKKEY